jgi:hypothetical protein
MQIPEYVKRELSEVYLLMDHIAGHKDRSLDAALAPATATGEPISVEEICEVAWPPNKQNRAKVLALVLAAKDRLSHAAFPATAHSIAFTYFSTNAPSWNAPGYQFRRLVNWLVPGFARGQDDRSPTFRPEPEVQSATPSSIAVGPSAIRQFARDAFPALEAKQDWLQRAQTKLKWFLLTLLVLTCLVSWDLAVGQRLLADFRWLSNHPEAILVEETARTTCKQIFPVSAEEAGALGQGSRCARLFAYQRVAPSIETWVRWQIPLRWFVAGSRALNAQPLPLLDFDTKAAPGSQATPDSKAAPGSQATPDTKAAPGSQAASDSKAALDSTALAELAKHLIRDGALLEVVRLLVTTLNYDILPLFLGALAATAAAWRSIVRKIAGNELEPRDLLLIWERVLLGAFLGSVIGLLVSPGASNGLFAVIGAAPNETNDTVALSPAVFGFLAGFATNRVFQWLDRVVEKIFAIADPNHRLNS